MTRRRRPPLDGGPWFSWHAIVQARRRFADLAPMDEVKLVEVLAASVLAAEVVDEEPGGYAESTPTGVRWVDDPDLAKVTLRGRVLGLGVEFVVEPITGCVITVIDPDEALRLAKAQREADARRRRSRRRRRR